MKCLLIVVPFTVIFAAVIGWMAGWETWTLPFVIGACVLFGSSYRK